MDPVRRRQSEARDARLEDGAGRRAARSVGVTSVVKARSQLEPERDDARDPDDASDEPLAIAAECHEVVQLCDAIGRKEARDEDVGIGKVQLLRLGRDVRRSDPEIPAPLPIEDRGKDARRIEPFGAIPVDRAVGTDQRDALLVADHTVLRDR